LALLRPGLLSEYKPRHV